MTTTDEQKIIDGALAEAQQWIDAFRPDGGADPYRVYSELKKVYPECLCLVVKSAAETPEAIRIGVSALLLSSMQPAAVDDSPPRGDPRGQLPLGLEMQLAEQYDRPDEVATWDALKQRLLTMTPDEEATVAAKVKELRPHDCVWDYYWMAFYESACGQLQDEPEFTRRSLFACFRAGMGYLVNLGSLKIGVCLPEAHVDDRRRLHRAGGPAIVWGDDRQWWHGGVRVEEGWIADPEGNCTWEAFLAETNTERRRAMAEIAGWDRILRGVDHQVIHTDETGDLIEVAKGLDDTGGMARFARVVCPSTGRVYLHRVAPTTTTCKEGVASMWGLAADQYAPTTEG
jgi:hypothetical protein